MTTARLCLYILLISSLEFLSNCVSVSLQKNELEPAKNVGYQIPLAPYEEIKLKSADKTWISKTTGNTLSFLSDCQKNSDPTLEQMLSDSVSVLDGLKISDNKELPYNGRSGLVSTAEGAVDGVKVKMRVLVFKKNNCNYTLSYAGVANKFETELKYFERFQQSFIAP